MTVLPDAREGRFGTPETGEVWFDFRVDRGAATLPGWRTRLISATHVIPFATAPRADVEIIGYLPAVVTWTIWLPSRESYRRLLARLGDTDTLMVRAGLQSQGETVMDTTVPYDILPATTLMEIGDERFELDDAAGCEATVTFQRSVNPRTGEVVPS